MHRGNVYIQSWVYVTDQEERVDIDKVYDNEKYNENTITSG